MKNFDHGGNLRRLAQAAGLRAEDVLDFSANLNPLGPPEWLRAVIGSHISALQHYPDPDCTELVQAVAERYRVDSDEVIVGNGSTEILYLLPSVLGKTKAVVPVPCYSDYARAARQAGMQVRTISANEELTGGSLKPRFGLSGEVSDLACFIEPDSIVFVGRPNNPTGSVCDAEMLRELAYKHPSTIFVVDEAFGDFVEGFDSLTERRPPNVIVVLSLTKIFAIPGLRLGCAVADRSIVQRLRDLQPPWTVNTLAQAVGVAALRDTEYLGHTRSYVSQQRKRLACALSSIGGLTVYPGQANFLLVRLDSTALNARQLARKLLNDGIAIRACNTFEGLDDRFFRVAVRTAEENAKLIDGLGRILHSRPPAVPTKRAASIMFQGTGSNAGKSVLTAALCRILHQDGLRVAAFKSQNMSLNSFVTRDGREMGRAQVVQAQACRTEPDVRMNPILLKPNSDTGSQVILLGKPVGNMNVAEYVRFKPQAFETAKRAFDELAAENDVIVLEGAGSPAEVNLKRHDIANMAMARHAEAPVLLVGDIDRGGVFASFVGTMEVLAEWERALIAGFIVNRFRGQKALLDDAFAYTERHTSRRVLGVVPYLADLRLPEEDSVSFKAAKSSAKTNGDGVEIAVVDLPHISNFTDFDAFMVEPDVHLRIVRSVDELGKPDAVILPGSKNVVADLGHLRQSGIAHAISGLAQAARTEIVGICGGYQMLGEKIEDPHQIESNGQPVQGLGSLACSTVMAAEKTLRRARGRHLESALDVEGYEIHHGKTAFAGQLVPLVTRADGEVIGVAAANRPIWGTYLHGIFDSDPFRRWFIDRLRVRRNLSAIGSVVATYDLEAAFDRLADVVRQSLNMDEIYRLLNL